MAKRAVRVRRATLQLDALLARLALVAVLVHVIVWEHQFMPIQLERNGWLSAVSFWRVIAAGSAAILVSARQRALGVRRSVWSAMAPTAVALVMLAWFRGHVG